MSWPLTLPFLVDPDIERVWGKLQKPSGGLFFFTLLGRQNAAADVFSIKNFIKNWPIKKKRQFSKNVTFFVAHSKLCVLLVNCCEYSSTEEGKNGRRGGVKGEGRERCTEGRNWCCPPVCFHPRSQCVQLSIYGRHYLPYLPPAFLQHLPANHVDHLWTVDVQDAAACLHEVYLSQGQQVLVVVHRPFKQAKPLVWRPPTVLAMAAGHTLTLLCR